MRQYDDPVEVRRGEARGPRPVPVARAAVEGARRRRALGGDRAVVAGQPAGRPPAGGATTDLVAERELWRVEAGRGLPARADRTRSLRRLRPLLRLDRRALAARRLPGLRGDAPRLHREPHLLPATAHSYLERSATSLRDAITARDVPTRYACAHVAALCAAAALLAARARPAPRGRRQKNAWVLLAEVAPELSEWASFFAAGRRQAGRRRGRVDARGHRARGRRPGPRRRPVPGRHRAGARPRAARQRGVRCRRTPSSTSTSPPATPCSTAPPTRTSWWSAPPSRRWTRSRSPTATAPTAR